MQAEVDVLIDKLKAHPGVEGVVALSIPAEGPTAHVLKSTFDNQETTIQFATLAHSCSLSVGSTLQSVFPEENLACCRLTTKKHEIIISKEKTYVLVVVQKLTPGDAE
eukprot:CAMPEP_0177670816 /NCGR_PEP_ID=MMETSP0447-20121125/24315_1 /TAXON_ID=0 /ORGANISM="Stygamoeba regulata, Strain BSH-02190019" /LENGTH=107 /DNA_ID=CAMNT_0019178053 /DNA_START=41 /DNA_END=364 /DNA_ORIENTATION=+